jgi:hypothetical protein
VDQELESARARHPVPFGSWTMAADVISKQLTDLEGEIDKGSPDPAMLSEVIQIAAMCARAAHDLGVL